MVFSGSLFSTNCNTEHYQIILSFSILTGIGSFLLLTPSMGCVAHGFMERRGLASGIAFVGDGFGGVLFPLMIQSLLPQVGWEWSIRILGVVLLLLCSMNVTFCRSRIPPRKGAATTRRDTLPDPQTEQEPWLSPLLEFCKCRFLSANISFPWLLHILWHEVLTTSEIFQFS